MARLYAAKNPDGSYPTRDQQRAAAANQLAGIAMALDPSGEIGISDLVQTVWRTPKVEARDDVVTKPLGLWLELLDALLPIVQLYLDDLADADGDVTLDTIELRKPLTVSTIRRLVFAYEAARHPEVADRHPDLQGAPSAVAIGADHIKHMVDRFLGWKLPDTFRPDGGISFMPRVNEGTQYAYASEPSGTNLFDATQAEAMVRYMLEGLPGPSPQPRAMEAPAEVAVAPPPVSPEVAEALAPFAALAVARRHNLDADISDIHRDPKAIDGDFAEVFVGDLRNLLRAAGLFTDDMLPSPTSPGAAVAGEAAKEPPPSVGAEDAPCASCGAAAGDSHEADCAVAGQSDDDTGPF